MKPMLTYAIWYHRRGVGVIPIQPQDKRALISWEQFQKRRPLEEEITVWWTEWPDANIGVITGNVSGIVVLDADGPESEKTLKDKHLPPTSAVQTGKGYHYWFRYPGSLRCWSRKQPGLDFRADGGYVLVPPSVHPSGARYEWAVKFTDKEGLADLPDWIIRLCGQSRTVIKVEGKPEWYEKALEGTTEGERNTTATRLAGRYLGLGLSIRETTSLLTNWNKENKPQLPEEDIQRVVLSISQAETSKRTAEALVAGTEVELDTLSEQEQRDIILAALTQALGGIKIHRIIKYMSERPVYTLETSSGSIELGDVSNLINQIKFRHRIAELENKYLKPFTRQVWNSIASRLLQICEEIEVSEEATSRGQIQNWLTSYIGAMPPIEDLSSALASGRAFKKDGEIYVSLSSFLKYIVLAQMERGLSQKDLAVRLREAGAERTTMRIEGKPSKCWRIPIEFFSSD